MVGYVRRGRERVVGLGGGLQGERPASQPQPCQSSGREGGGEVSVTVGKREKEK